jgi:hypothetical protein
MYLCIAYFRNNFVNFEFVNIKRKEDNIIMKRQNTADEDKEKLQQKEQPPKKMSKEVKRAERPAADLKSGIIYVYGHSKHNHKISKFSTDKNSDDEDKAEKPPSKITKKEREYYYLKTVKSIKELANLRYEVIPVSNMKNNIQLIPIK